MATGTSYSGKTIAVGDMVSPFGIVSSSAGANITIELLNSGNSITVAKSNCYSPSLSGAAQQTPVNGEPITVHSGVVTALAGSGPTAKLTVLLGDGTSQTINAQDCYGNDT
jgi:hypothetical protein